MADRNLEKVLTCSFCGKSQKKVRKLIAGPTVYSCDECIALGNQVIGEEIAREEGKPLSRAEATLQSLVHAANEVAAHAVELKSPWTGYPGGEWLEELLLTGDLGELRTAAARAGVPLPKVVLFCPVRTMPDRTMPRAVHTDQQQYPGAQSYFLCRGTP